MGFRIFSLGALLCMALISCKQLSIEEQAEKIHDEIVSIDTHTDTPLSFLDENFDIGIWNDYKETRTRIDFPRMKKGRLDAAFMAVFIGQGKRDVEGNEKAKQRALEIFDATHKTVAKYPDMAEIAYTPDDVCRLKKEDKRAVYIGIENGYPVGTDIANIEEFYNLGGRYITLCHTKNNDICDSSTDQNGAEHDGLSQFGVDVVKEMNRLGMLIDVSHISDEAFYDVLEVSKAPVIASHSSVRAICNSPRNFDDNMLIKLKENGGVIQICILSSYVREPAPNPERDSAFDALRVRFRNFEGLSDEEMAEARKAWRATSEKYPRELATVSEVVDHIDYVVEKIGIDYVGIGTDFDGGGGVEGCIDASEMKNITIELLKRAYTKEQIKKIWGENFLRVFRKVHSMREI